MAAKLILVLLGGLLLLLGVLGATVYLRERQAARQHERRQAREERDYSLFEQMEDDE